MSKPKVIDLHCQVRTEDFMRVHEVETGTLELAMYYKDIYNGQPAYRAVRLNKDDALRLRDQINNTFPAEPKPVAPGREYSFDGLGSKLLRIEPVPGSEQLVLNVCDSEGKHHIVMDKSEATRLAQRLHWEYLFDGTKASARPAAAAPQVTPATPNWNDNPGTLSLPVPDCNEPFEVCLVDNGTKVELSWDHALMGIRLDGKELAVVISHLQHCRHHMHSLVRVKEVGVHHPGHNQGPKLPPRCHVVMDMQGEPLAVLHSSEQLDDYLSTNKLRVAQ